MDIGWWASFAIIAAALAVALTQAILEMPWPRERTMHLTAVLPFPREAVWRAWAADKRVLTPGRTFDTARPGEVLEIARLGGADGREACRVRLTVMAAKPAEVLAVRHISWNGMPSPGGPNACEAILLADDPAGTRVTLLVNLETPTLAHGRALGPALDHALLRLQRELGMAGAAEEAALAG